MYLFCFNLALSALKTKVFVNCAIFFLTPNVIDEFYPKLYNFKYLLLPMHTYYIDINVFQVFKSKRDQADS